MRKSRVWLKRKDENRNVVYVFVALLLKAKEREMGERGGLYSLYKREKKKDLGGGGLVTVGGYG